MFDTDRGGRFTGTAFTAVPYEAGVAISMDGKGARAAMTVLIERPWRSVTDEEVCPRACDSVSQARASIGRSPAFYETRPHSAQGGQTPDQAYLDPPGPIPAAP